MSLYDKKRDNDARFSSFWAFVRISAFTFIWFRFYYLSFIYLNSLLASVTSASRNRSMISSSLAHYVLVSASWIRWTCYPQSAWFDMSVDPDGQGNSFTYIPLVHIMRGAPAAGKRATLCRNISFLILCDWGLPQATATDRLCEGDNDACTHSCQSAS